ncbi:MAG: hypothetical protein B7O98_00520 [Zestosphaera tikiterensis]|uniref:Uncharacterized protein n=1 Tax=Zestosphaera tikiterensis TaxID=1973259 RepID=A0A2R7Y960_9CREN|nr:MAG: hypothetical protein B7O98_00520 [Zestosphaera tikiterensis]
MSEKLVDLYLLLDNDPLSLFKSSRDEAAGKRLEPLKSIEDLITLIFNTYRFKKISEELAGILEEASNIVLKKRIYEDIEEWSIRGIINWPKTIVNYIHYRPVVQAVVSYTSASPENLLLRAIVDYVISELSNICSLLERGGSAETGGTGLSPEEIAKLPGLRSAREEACQTLERLEHAVGQSFLVYIPGNLYGPETLDHIYELTNEVSNTPWRPEWVDKLLDNVVYKYLFDPSTEKEYRELTIKVLERISRREHDSMDVNLLSDKLYELYLLYLLLRVLREQGKRPAINQCGKLGKSGVGDVVVCFNQDLEAPLKVRPDILVHWESRNVVIELKFSSLPGYIGKGVYQAISYMVLLGAGIGLLIHLPKDEQEASEGSSEDEDEAVVGQLELEKPVEITACNGSCKYVLYRVEIEPLGEKEEDNIKKLRDLLVNAV